MSRHIALVVNPTSGRGLGARVAPVVRQRLESAGLSVTQYETTCAEDVGRISAAATARSTSVRRCWRSRGCRSG